MIVCIGTKIKKKALKDLKALWLSFCGFSLNVNKIINGVKIVNNYWYYTVSENLYYHFKEQGLIFRVAITGKGWTQ